MQPILMIENGKLLKVKELPSVQLYLLKPNRVTLLLCTKGVFVKFFKISKFALFIANDRFCY